MIQYPIFYRRHGVRLIQQLITPPLSEVAELELPIGSIYHFSDYDGIVAGPTITDPLLKSIKRPIYVSHITALSSFVSAPRHLAISTANDIRDYHNQNRQMRILKTLEGVQRDQMSQLVINYSLIARTHKYVRSFYSEYHKWYNTFSTIIDKAVEVSTLLNRQHFIVANTPKVIPSMQQLTVASSGMNQTLLKVFRDKDSYLLLELWKWVNLANTKQEDLEGTNKSIFSKIPLDKIHLFNILYIEDTKWTTLNLGQLLAFNNSSLNNDKLISKSNDKIDASQLQKRILRMAMSIMEVRTLAAAEEEGVNIDEVKKDGELVIETPKEEVQKKVPIPVVINDSDLDNESVENKAERLRVEDAKLDDDLAQLNEISKMIEEKETSTSSRTLNQVLYETSNPPLEDGIISVCNKLADDGLLSAAEYKRMIANSTRYKALKAPDGITPLHEFAKIKPEDLIITESRAIPDRETVLDKSMLKSSLLEFDSRYIEHVMSKDIANVVLSLQKAGIAVVDYEVERQVNILGEADQYLIKIQPVIGRASTLRFKLPVVNKNGVYKANNVLYRLRKQRSD